MKSILSIIVCVLLSVGTAFAQPSEHLIKQKNGKNIYGILSLPTNEKEESHGVAIISHGFNGTHHFGRDYFKTLNDLGYAVYTFDFPCGSIHSQSDNNTMNMSVSDEKEALKEIVSYFRKQKDVDKNRIVLIGESQGGLVSALAAAELKEKVSNLVLIYPALCIPDNWNERYPRVEDIPEVSEIWGVKLGKKFMLDIRPMKPFETIGKYKGRVLIIHGTDDKVVPLDYSKRALQTYKNATLKIIDKAGHGFKPAERELSNKYVKEFLATTVPEAQPYSAFCIHNSAFSKGSFPLFANSNAAVICTDKKDFAVVGIAAKMFAEDIQRVTGQLPELTTKADAPKQPTVIAGTLGKSKTIDQLVKSLKIDVSGISGKWESYIITTAQHPKTAAPLLLIIGSDRRGTAFGLTSLSEAIGVSPWYWWADVTPARKESLFVEPGLFCQGEPAVQYRGIFINDERFGGWARWAEQHFEKETGKVGPKTYQKVFELLLRLKANYLWPAMHPGTQAFNADPENARLADDYAIVMGTSHCEQMLRNNEGEWKAVNEQAQREGRTPPLGDFNYITNRKTMQDYWETRVKTNGKYENTYTLGLRGIHDYPMEGANTTAERVKLMQQAIDDQRDMLRRNIRKPIEEIPQVLCTYEEVLDAYHNGLKVPEDVTMLWSDDKHGYCRNLCNPNEQKRKGGAGIYYHLSYHGDPASWIWLSPLSPTFLSTELTKAYTFGAKKIWVFNVGDIKPAEKEISFVMDLAWDINRWSPSSAKDYIRYWAEKTFGKDVAQEISDMQRGYYKLQAAGKDSHVWFVNYSEEQIAQRTAQWRALAAQASDLSKRIPASLQDAYFELVLYPIRGAAMINEYQLLARRSMVRASEGKDKEALADGERVKEMFGELNAWTKHYNNDVKDGKWADFFNWQPYHWFRSEKIEQPFCTPEVLAEASKYRNLEISESRNIEISESRNIDESNNRKIDKSFTIESESDCSVPLWIEALSPIQNFSKEAKDNIFCHVTTGNDSFDASATPINNVWHAPYVGPMWSRVGTLHLKKGTNRLAISDVKPDARIDQIFVGLYPPFVREPRLRLPATSYQNKQGNISRIEDLGYAGGVLVQPFDATVPEASASGYTAATVPDDLSSTTNITSAPYVEYELDIKDGDSAIEIRTLPTLRVYEGRDARYAVQVIKSTNRQIDKSSNPEVFSIHTGDFTAEWRWNVLRGYSSRTVKVTETGTQKVRIYLLDPGIVLQEILVH